MKTNFFNQIAALNQTGIWRITIQNDEQGNFTVSQLFTTNACGDSAAKAIAPMLLRGTATELGEGFFDTIAEPLQKTAGLMHNMEEYLKTVEQARIASKLEQDKRNKEKADKAKSDKNPECKPSISAEEKEEKRKAYFDAIKLVVELEGKCQYEEALAQLPSIENYPDKSAEITKRKADLEKKAQQKQNLLL